MADLVCCVHSLALESASMSTACWRAGRSHFRKRCAWLTGSRTARVTYRFQPSSSQTRSTKTKTRRDRLKAGSTFRWVYTAHVGVSTQFLSSKSTKSTDFNIFLDELLNWIWVLFAPVRLLDIVYTAGATCAMTVCLQVSPQQMIQAQGPLEVFKNFHNKFCLVVGQGKIFEIAKEYPFVVDRKTAYYPHIVWRHINLEFLTNGFI